MTSLRTMVQKILIIVVQAAFVEHYLYDIN